MHWTMTIICIAACLAPMGLWFYERSRRKKAEDAYCHELDECVRMDCILTRMATAALGRWELFDDETWDALKEWRERE